MITADEAVFPNNVVKLMADRFAKLDQDLQVFKRPLRSDDPVQSIGVFGALWTPDNESFEMKGFNAVSPQEPTLQRYSIAIQAFVKDMDEVRGLMAHSVLSKMVLAMIYRDEPLRVGLAGLATSMYGVTEKTRRWGVTTQRYLNNELNSEWLYLSTVECWLETENT